MRISDWSSDVCSSDLDGEPGTAADKVNAPFARRELRLDAGAVRQRDAGAVLEHELAGRIVSDDRLGAAIAEQHPGKIGSATGRERVGQDVTYSVVGG